MFFFLFHDTAKLTTRYQNWNYTWKEDFAVGKGGGGGGKSYKEQLLAVGNVEILNCRAPTTRALDYVGCFALFTQEDGEDIV